MTQILGTGEGKTSSAAKEPVVERKPAQVFFESMALAASMSGYYLGPQLQRWEIPFIRGGLWQVSEKASRGVRCWLRLIPPHRCSAWLSSILRH